MQSKGRKKTKQITTTTPKPIRDQIPPHTVSTEIGATYQKGHQKEQKPQLRCKTTRYQRKQRSGKAEIEEKSLYQVLADKM